MRCIHKSPPCKGHTPKSVTTAATTLPAASQGRQGGRRGGVGCCRRRGGMEPLPYCVRLAQGTAMDKYISIYQNMAYDDLKHMNCVKTFFPLVGISRDLMESGLRDEPPSER